ncbi:unnamed protein product [Sphacelaria rigidula]
MGFKAAALAAVILANATVRGFAPNGSTFRHDSRHDSRPLSSSSLRTRTSSPNRRSQTAPVLNSNSNSNSNTASNKVTTPTWRLELDNLIKAASPWGSPSETAIIAMDLLKRLPEVAEDVTDAARRGTLVSEVVLGEDTEARLTIDGLRAVNQQLRKDIVPQALESAPRVAKAASESLLQQRPSVGAAAGTPRAKRGGGRTGPMEGVAETLYQIRSVAKKLRPKELRESLEAVRTEAINVVSRTPEGLYSPEYSVVDERDGFEVRRYSSYAICSAPMTGTTTSYVQNDDNEDEGPSGIRDTISGSGEGFNTLAGYLFGNNTAERAMSMTTPVNIDVSPQTRTMSFIMPKDVPAGEAPAPNDPRIGVSDVDDGETLAVKEFYGFATDGEVKRQLDALLQALEASQSKPRDDTASGTGGERPTWRAEDPSGMSYRLMQFNPPYTLPWLRTNAIAVKVSKEQDLSSSRVPSEPMSPVSDPVDVSSSFQ